MGAKCYKQDGDMKSMSNGWSDSNPTNQVGLEFQTEERRAPPLSSDETGEQSRYDSVDVESLELRQAVTTLKSQTTDFSNDAQVLKRINAQPLSELVMFWRSTIDVIVEGLGTNYFDTMFHEKDRAGIGVIIRECQGKGLAHMVGIIPLPLTIIELETLAMSKALQFDANLSLEDVTTEGVLEFAM
nr:hypothetical protein CFP56_44214 [Quercus suber]